jgi:hypothetical protein
MIKPTIIKDLPESAIDVSEIIYNKISLTHKDSDKPLIGGIDELKVYYSIAANEFYVKRGDIYKVLRWRTQTNRTKDKNYTYEYTLIPYKKQMPLKILKRSWTSQIIS